MWTLKERGHLLASVRLPGKSHLFRSLDGSLVGGLELEAGAAGEMEESPGIGGRHLPLSLSLRFLSLCSPGSPSVCVCSVCSAATLPEFRFSG